MAIKIKKSIINSQHSLIGFVISGTEKELGGIGNQIVERSISIDEILHSRFSNRQMSVVNSKMVTKDKFKINQLPMLIFNGNDYFDYNNTISLIGRFVQDNENIGFRVKFADGTEDNLKYDAVLMICKWFNPENFSIRTSSKGRSYICAKQGYGSIDELPATVIGEKSTAKRTKSAAKDKINCTTGTLDNGIDIIDIYNFIDSCHGSVIKLPYESYTAASETVSTNGDFISAGIGEVASAKPIFSNNKLNVNAGFKKVGNVKITVNGIETLVPAFTFRTKSIFLNGENYMKKFGIALPKEDEAKFVKTLSSSLALSKIEDTATTAPISSILGNNNLVFYKVDTSKIDLISPSKREKSIKSNSELIRMCTLMYELKLISKATGPKGGIMKELKEALGASFVAEATGKKVFSAYAMYTKEGLDILESYGVDIYSGAYTAPSSESKANKNYSEDSTICIEYMLDGYDYNKITGTKVVDFVVAGDKTAVPPSVFKIVLSLLSITDFSKRYSEANRIYKETEIKIAELNKIFWMHNASMFINGNKSRVHTHDADKWVANTNTRVKKALVFNCKESGCENLSVKLTNVTI